MPRPTASFRARPGLVRAGLALAAALAIGACSKSGGSPYSFPSVILVTVDTLRADRLSCYGYARETSPNVDRRIAARAVRFTNATAASNNTSCSFASIHTGTYVRTHGVVSLAPLGYAVPERFETLAETLRGMGYATAAAVSAAHLNAEISGLGQGFDVYADHDGKEPKRRAADTNKALLGPLRDLLATRAGPDGAPAKKKPLFLWVHYFDPHWPYEPEAADVAALPLPAGASADEKLPDLKPVLAGDSDDGAFLRERADEISARYDAEIHEADRGVGELFDFLEAERVLENAIVLFTADHGENLGEHGLFFNHSRLYEPVIRVPLLIAAPGVEPRVASDLAHGIDIVPTVLDLLHASSRAPKELEGESLAPLLLRSRPPARDAVYSESGNWRDKAVKTAAGEKLILPPGLFGAELFDLASDPGETHDLANERPERRDAFARAVEEFAGRVTWRFRITAPAGSAASARIEAAAEAPGGGSALAPRALALEAAAGAFAEDAASVGFGGLFVRGLDAATLRDATLGFRPFLDHLVSIVVEPGAIPGGDAPVVLRREPSSSARGETLVVEIAPSDARATTIRVGSSGLFGEADLAGAPGFSATTVEGGHRLRLAGRSDARAVIRVPLAPGGAIVLADGIRDGRRLAPGDFAAGPPGAPPALYVSPTLLSAEASPDEPRMKEVLARPGLHVWREPGKFRLHREAKEMDAAERKRLEGLGYLGGPNR